MPDIDTILSDLPNLHVRLDAKGNPFFASGGFDKSHLLKISDLIDKHVENISEAKAIETGAGLSTILFLAKGFSTVTSIAPDLLMERNLYSHCARNGINAAPLDFRPARSEHELPKIAETLGANGQYDFALIDGDHGWPNVFVDFCYINYSLKSGGIILLDDCQMYPVAELVNFLKEEAGWEHVASFSKMNAFKRLTHERFTSGAGRPYLRRKTEEMSKK